MQSVYSTASADEAGVFWNMIFKILSIKKYTYSYKDKCLRTFPKRKHHNCCKSRIIEYDYSLLAFWWGFCLLISYILFINYSITPDSGLNNTLTLSPIKCKTFTSKKNILCMTLNSIWWRFSSSDYVGMLKTIPLALQPGSFQPVKFTSMSQRNLFKSNSYSAGIITVVP